MYTDLRLPDPPGGRNFPVYTGFHHQVSFLRRGGSRRFTSVLSVEHQLDNRGQEMKWNLMYETRKQQRKPGLCFICYYFPNILNAVAPIRGSDGLRL